MDPEDFAEEYGVSLDDAEDLLEAIVESGPEWDAWREDDSADTWEDIVPLDDAGHPDDEFMEWLAEQWDLDISDLYDMYYGYDPE